MAHVVQVVQDQKHEWFGRCTCGQGSGVNRFKHKWEAEDWNDAHMESVAHALAVLHRQNGSLKIERDHARAMLDNPNTPKAERAMWQILFDGADRRLRDNGGPDPEADGLW